MFPGIQGIKQQAGYRNNLCYATTNRQRALRELSKDSTLTIVIGSTTSSNSNRLRLVAERRNNVGLLVNDITDIDLTTVDQHEKILITAGASAPQDLIEEIIHFLKLVYRISTWKEVRVVEETEVFPPMKIEVPSKV